MWLNGINSDSFLEADIQVCISNTESEEGSLFALVWKLHHVHLLSPFSNNQEIRKSDCTSYIGNSHYSS